MPASSQSPPKDDPKSSTKHNKKEKDKDKDEHKKKKKNKEDLTSTTTTTSSSSSKKKKASKSSKSKKRNVNVDDEENIDLDDSDFDTDAHVDTAKPSRKSKNSSKSKSKNKNKTNEKENDKREEKSIETKTTSTETTTSDNSEILMARKSTNKNDTSDIDDGPMSSDRRKLEPSSASKSTTSSTSTSAPNIKVLVCSGNLGNALPDTSSMEAWIPNDGRCDRVLTSPPKFPVIMDPRRAKNPILNRIDKNTNNNSNNNKNDDNVAEGKPSPTMMYQAVGNQRTKSGNLHQQSLGNPPSIDASNKSSSTPLSSPNSSSLLNDHHRHDAMRTLQPDFETFDIICIGMQEATFETTGSNAETDDDENIIDEEWNEHDDDEDDDEDDKGLKFDFDAVPPSYQAEESNNYPPPTAKASRGSSTGSKSAVGKLFGVGKASLKATMKMTKTTVKHAKTVNTLASSKDHTDRSVLPVKAEDVTNGFPGWSSTDVLHFQFQQQLPTYKRAISHQLGEMRLVLFYNPGKIHVKVLSVKYKPTGKGGLANKGGIVAEILVNQSTRISFLTAHLEAHEGMDKFATRCASCMDILTHTKAAPSPLTPTKLDASLSSHFTFVMGDLNFRTRIPNVEPGSERHIKISRNMTKAKDWVLLNKYDELSHAVRNKECLAGFRTPYCNFDPTFKVERQLGYEYNPKRSPSYTDRILFKTGDQLEPAIRPILYEPVEDYTTSDHKPIRGAFTIRLNEPLRWNSAIPVEKQQNLRDDEVDDNNQPYYSRPQNIVSWNRGHVNRETLHVLVSSISCTIDPDNYDKLRKLEKAELPNSFLSFVTTPGNAIVLDQSKKSLWRKLDYGSILMTKDTNKKEKKKKSSSSFKNLKNHYPHTSTVKSTMKPKFSESTHFAIRTHMMNGSPVNFSGSLLHITLFDKKEEKSIGSCSINLQEIIRLTKKQSLIKTTTGGPVRHLVPTNSSSAKGRPAPPRRARSETMPIRRSNNARPTVPSRGASSGQLRLERRGALRSIKTGPSNSIKNILFHDAMSSSSHHHLRMSSSSTTPNEHSVDKRLKDLKCVSMHLDEPLYEGAMEIARIKCDMDFWWVKDPPL